MEDNYIHFKIDGRDLKIHKENPDDIFMWKTQCSRGKMKNPRWNKIKVQTRLDGYKQIKINKKMFQLHRVNYYSHNPTWDIHDSSMDNFIDHKDINKTNNNIENLRIVTHQENCFNTNCKGFCWYKQLQKWQAYINVNGKRKHLGYFLLEEEARQVYLDAKKIYHKI